MVGGRKSRRIENFNFSLFCLVGTWEWKIGEIEAVSLYKFTNIPFVKK